MNIEITLEEFRQAHDPGQTGAQTLETFRRMPDYLKRGLAANILARRPGADTNPALRQQIAWARINNPNVRVSLIL